jgi:hypothetical protein
MVIVVSNLAAFSGANPHHLAICGYFSYNSALQFGRMATSSHLLVRPRRATST